MNDERNIPGCGETPEQDAGAATVRGMSKDELLDLINAVKAIVASRYFGPLDCEDLVMQALADVLDGRRKKSWNSSYTPFENLCLIARSIAGNQWSRERKSGPLDPDSLRFAGPSAAASFETRESRRRIRAALKAVIGEGGFLRDVLLLALDVGWKPERIAAGLDVEVSAVYNARKRIRRKLKSLLGGR